MLEQSHHIFYLHPLLGFLRCEFLLCFIIGEPVNNVVTKGTVSAIFWQHIELCVIYVTIVKENIFCHTFVKKINQLCTKVCVNLLERSGLNTWKETMEHKDIITGEYLGKNERGMCLTDTRVVSCSPVCRARLGPSVVVFQLNCHRCSQSLPAPVDKQDHKPCVYRWLTTVKPIYVGHSNMANLQKIVLKFTVFVVIVTRY